MRCKQVREMIMTDYVDGDSPEGDIAAVDAHLAACASCRAALHHLRHTLRPLLKEASRVTPPGSVWNSILTGMPAQPEAGTSSEERRERTPVPARWISMLTPVMAVVLVFVLGLSIPRVSSWRRDAVVNQYLAEQVHFLAAMSLPENVWFYWQELYLGTSLEVFMMGENFGGDSGV